MSVMLDLSCSGCEAKARVGPLRRRTESVFFGSALCRIVTDDPENLTPEGWVMFDPYTYCCYCPACWTAITVGPEANPDDT